jgi:outer membrane protein assembly factor BamB
MKSFIVRRVLALGMLSALAALAACEKNKNVDPPAELTDFKATAKVEKVWSSGIGGGEPELRLGLGIVRDGAMIFAAGHGGDVGAFDIKTGRRIWKTDTKLALSGGPGAGQGVVVAGADHGDIVALDAKNGAIRWKTRLNSEILAAPAIGSDLVVMRTVDGRVSALRVADGSVAWTAEQQVPRLTLRGTAQPVIAGDLALSGFDNGRIMALALSNGATAWEMTVAPAAGRTELERLVDIDSAVKVVDSDVYAVTFQGKIARIARDTGQVWWSRDLSSYRGLDIDEDGVYISASDGSVVKIGRRTGVELWKQEALSRRRLSPPAVVGSFVVVADLDGYLHFLDINTGTLAARVHATGERVRAAPIVNGDTVIIKDDKGNMSAWRAVSTAPKVKAGAATAAPSAAAPATN